MSGFLIAANVALLFSIWFCARQTLLARPLLVLLAVMSLYFVMLPAFNTETLYAWRFARLSEEELRAKYLVASTVFLFFFLITLAIGIRIKLPLIDRGWAYLFSDLQTRGLLTGYLVFVVICFFAQTILHGSLFYVFESKSAFEVATENNSGRWSLVILGSSLIYPTVILIGHLQERRRLATVAFYTVTLSLIYLIVCTPQTRTWAAALLLSLMFLRSEKIGAFRFFGIALGGVLVGMILLIVLDIVRQGTSFSDIDMSEFLQNLPKALFLLFTPYENALLAIDHADATGSFFWFKYLLGAATPLQLLPGALFPFRPSVDKEKVMTESILGEIKDFDYFQDDSTFTFTIMGSGYSDAGMLGVAVAGVVYAFITVLLARGLFISASARLMSYFTLLLLFAGYRLSSEVNLQIVYIVGMFTVLYRMVCKISIGGVSVGGNKSP